VNAEEFIMNKSFKDARTGQYCITVTNSLKAVEMAREDKIVVKDGMGWIPVVEANAKLEEVRKRLGPLLGKKRMGARLQITGKKVRE